MFDSSGNAKPLRRSPSPRPLPLGEGATSASFSSVVSRQWQSVYAGYWVWMGPEGVK
ncbi:MAG: hypothetical protein IH623_23070 [Verrucomicrobia bacterium]|nr:hypothetical protein [Verrucomicrobiota bacterium]